MRDLKKFDTRDRELREQVEYFSLILKKYPGDFIRYMEKENTKYFWSGWFAGSIVTGLIVYLAF